MAHPALDLYRSVSTLSLLLETHIMADFTGLNSAIASLQAEVTLAIQSLNTLFADLTAALASGAAQPQIDAAASAVQNQINALAAAVSADMPPAPPPPPPPPVGATGATGATGTGPTGATGATGLGPIGFTGATGP